MSVERWTISSLLLALIGLVGCAGLPPAPPAVPTPQDLIKAIPQGNNTTLVNVAPASQHMTLPEFLGITRCRYAAQGCCYTIRNQVAFCFPSLAGVIEPGAGVLSPAEAAGQSPAVEAAANIKAEEAKAQDKIAALRYLATIGCAGCYEGVEQAFIDALDDCTESVRFEAVLAIYKTACCCDKCCECNEKACCSEKIQKKLMELAYDVDDYGCPKEPSERVRRKARLALCQCGPPRVEPTPPAPVTPEPPVKKPETELEGPTKQPAANGATAPANANGSAEKADAAAESAADDAGLPPPDPQK